MSAASQNPADIKTVLDIDSLLNNLGDNMELLDELATTFSAESSEQIKQIRDHISNGDLNAAAMVSHTLKGAVGNFAARPAYYAVAEVEKMCREQQPDETSQALEGLEREINRLNSALVKIIEEL